jgi:hypothetical protein
MTWGMIHLLQHGVTGFRDARSVTELPRTDIRDFTRSCCQACRELGLSYDGVLRPPFPSANFTTLMISDRGERIGVIVNNHYPIIACVSLPMDSGTLDFIPDHGVLSWLCAHTSYTYPGIGPLFEHPGRNALSLLSATEMRQIGYHEPQFIHEIVFNCWD